MKLSLAAGTLALSLLLAVLAGCGATVGAGGASEPVALTCVNRAAAHPIDIQSVVLTCAVAHAPSDATSFTLQYTVMDSLGQPRTMGATCASTLSNGAGSCTQTYSLPIPLDPTKAKVSGTLHPGGQTLGPVTPKQQPAP